MMVSRQGDWIWSRSADEIVMMSPASALYIGLTEVGAYIWELLDHPRSVDDICARVADEFEVTPDRCRPDVETFLRDLEGKGAVSLGVA